MFDRHQVERYLATTEASTRQRYRQFDWTSCSRGDLVRPHCIVLDSITIEYPR